MKKALKFNRFSTKRKMIQYSLISVILIFLSLYIFNTGKKITHERRVKLIKEYSHQVSSLKIDKKENLKKIELEYDEKILKLQSKITNLEKKVYK